MSDLFGGLATEQPARPTDRLFFALFPDPATAGRIAVTAQGLKAQHRLAGRILAPDRFHITLQHLGDFAGVPASVVTQARQAAGNLAAAPFEVAFDHAASFQGRPGNRPFVLRSQAGSESLIAFQQALGAAMLRAGLRPDRSFTPHVTLLYDDALVPETPIEPIRWTVSELVLVHSLLGQTRHIPLARWPLA